MGKSVKYVLIAFAILLVAIGGFYLIDYLIDNNSKKEFINNSLELYKQALENKKEDTKYFDSKSNKLSNSELNYHIEFGEEGIMYFLSYNDEHVIEIVEKNVTENDFNVDRNYKKLSENNYLSSIKNKHDILNAKFVNGDANNENYQEDQNTIELTPDDTNPIDEPIVNEPIVNEPVVNEPVEDEKYIVSFDLNGGTSGYQSTVEVKYNEMMPEISTSIPVRDGYTFMGYYDNTDYTKGNVYYNELCAATKYYDKKSNMTLYAGWKQNNTEVTPSTPITTPENPSTSTEKLTYKIGEVTNCSANSMPKKAGVSILSSSDEYKVVIGMGKKNHGGYSVIINSVNIDSNNNVTITASGISPGINDMTTQAINYPCAVVIFNQQPNNIEYNLIGITNNNIGTIN